MNRGARIFLGLGSNLGDRLSQLRGAVEQLCSSTLKVRRVSSVYESRYVGPGSQQPKYLNMVLEGQTRLLPRELLSLTQRIEIQHGRAPGSHMRARSLDVDILLYGGWIVRHPDLVVPHPRLQDRRFVLEPLAELGVLLELPLDGLGGRLRRLQGQQEVVWYCKWPLPGGTRDAFQL